MGRHHLESTLVLLLSFLFGSTNSIAIEHDTLPETRQLLLNASTAATWNIDRYVPETQITLAELYLLTDDKKTAERWLLRAVKNTDASIDNELRAKIYTRAAKGYFKLAKKEDADVLFRKSLDEAKQIYRRFYKEMAYGDVARNSAAIEYAPDLIITAIKNNNSSIKSQLDAFRWAADKYFMAHRQTEGLRIVDSWLQHINNADSEKRDEYRLDVAATLIVWANEYKRAYLLIAETTNKKKSMFVRMALMRLARDAISNNKNRIASKALLEAEQRLRTEQFLLKYLGYAEIAYLLAKAGNVNDAKRLVDKAERGLKQAIRQNLARPSIRAQTYQWLSNAHKTLRMQKKSWRYTSSALMELNKIESGPKKDKAIASVAGIRALIPGDSVQVAEMIDRISGAKIKDDTLNRIAITFAKNNLLNEATVLIDKIQDDKKRDSSYQTLLQLHYIRVMDYVVEKGRDHLLPRLISNAVETANKLGDPGTRATKLTSIAEKALSVGNSKQAGEIIDAVVTIIDQEKDAYRKASRLIHVSRVIIENNADLSTKSTRRLQPLAKLYSPVSEEAQTLIEEGDIQAAQEKFIKAAEAGDRQTQYIVASGYANGSFGLQRSAKQYKSWMNKSANNGYAAAQHEIGRLNIARDDKLAADFFWKAAEQGHDQSQHTLIIISTEKSDAIPESVLKQAKKWASEGNAQLQSWLGVIYYQGKKLKKDHKIAARWFGKAAVAGNTHAQFSIGVMMYLGEGTPKDAQRARYWLNLAANKQYEPAIKFLEHVNKNSKTK